MITAAIFIAAAFAGAAGFVTGRKTAGKQVKPRRQFCGLEYSQTKKIPGSKYPSYSVFHCNQIARPECVNAFCANHCKSQGCGCCP